MASSRGRLPLFLGAVKAAVESGESEREKAEVVLHVHPLSPLSALPDHGRLHISQT